MGRVLALLIIVFSFCVNSKHSFALTQEPKSLPAKIVVTLDELTSVDVSITVGGETKTETVFCKDGTPGQVKESGGQTLFTPYIDLIKKLKMSNKGGKKFARLKQLNKKGKPACGGGGDQSSDSSSSADSSTDGSPTPTRTPTRTPTPSTGNFDANGNVTAAGKALFGIPSSLSANVSEGRSIHQSLCSGCHGEKTNESFNQLRNDIALSPMLYTSSDIPDPELADLTAYLNRFRQ